MKILCNLLIVGCLLIFPLVSHAEPDQEAPVNQTASFQLALLYPLQMRPGDYNVDDFRLDLIYGVNEDVQGLDIGIVNKSTGSVHGVELGAVNLVKRDFTGFQAGVFFNETQEDMCGLQLGIVNHAGSLRGIQIGLLNFNDDTKYLGFFPFINAAF